MIGAVILQIFLIFLNSIFSSAEIAIVSLTEADIHKLEEDGDRRAKKLERITKQPTRFLVTIQAAVTIINFLVSALAADAFAGPLVKALKNSWKRDWRLDLSTESGATPPKIPTKPKAMQNILSLSARSLKSS